MQKLKSLSANAFNAAIRSSQLRLRIGPYVFSLQSDLSNVIEGIKVLYSDFPLAAPADFVDYNISLRYASSLARLRQNSDFYYNHHRPFDSIKTRQAYASIEWGMNWCVSVQANEYLKLHAAVIARNGQAIVMPGIPGAGKSTLCAAMGLSGWRILSDEHALIRPGTAQVAPLCRPVSLKNESIPLIRAFDQGAVFGPVSKDTHKGNVAHMKADLVAGCHDTSELTVTSMVFPRYSKDDPQQLSQRSRTQSFILAAYHSFNYSLLGSAGFQAMVTLIEAVECYDLVYHDLEWAIQSLEKMHDGQPG
jgi:HprK-related kinase A